MDPANLLTERWPLTRRCGGHWSPSTLLRVLEPSRIAPRTIQTNKIDGVFCSAQYQRLRASLDGRTYNSFTYEPGHQPQPCVESCNRSPAWSSPYTRHDPHLRAFLDRPRVHAHPSAWLCAAHCHRQHCPSKLQGWEHQRYLRPVCLVQSSHQRLPRFHAVLLHHP